MTSASIYLSRTSASRTGGLIQQLPSHAPLLRDVSGTPAPPIRSRRGRPDAIIVPAARPASALVGLIELAADLETQLVVLCSHQAKVEQVRERMGRIPRARGLVVQVNCKNNLSLLDLDLETSSPGFLAASSDRASNLSLKRNFGLLLARLLGWNKVVFIDDDITVSRADIARLAAQLDIHQIAGMICRYFPDNSVVCHARRLARLPQDNFVTGAVLGVNCSETSLPRFFPDLYNEDWFFFAEAAARRQLAKVGEARQADYNPFAKPVRARHEEFGDLVAEGLYSLIESTMFESTKEKFDDMTDRAATKYWSSFIDARREGLAETVKHLKEFRARDSCSDDVEAAITSISAADELYDDPKNGGHTRIDADLCAGYVDALQWDGKQWQDYYQGIPNLGSIRDAMSWLGAAEWMSVRSPLLEHS